MTSMKDAAPDAVGSSFLEEKATENGPQPLNPMDHLAYAIISDAGESAEASLAAIALLRKHFIDWHEIRVARTWEVARAMGGQAWTETAAKRIIEEYNSFFDKRGNLSYDFLAATKAAEGRKLLQQYLPHLRKGAYALLLFLNIPGSALPLSDEGLKAAKRHGLLSKSGDRGLLLRTLQESLDNEAIALVVQHLEIEATGNPYGEAQKPGVQAKPRKTKTATKKKK
ncbi:MAG: hypothetical protein LBT97_13700 [Planctomycetota bacterium]|jgi:hypothetical protein|nr:hypothetical protein [Planctomycetota bacterium]